MLVKSYLSLIKFSHTVFALPFALVGFFLGISKINTGTLDYKILILIVLCMVFARSAAMAFNRYIDRDIDAINPRSAQREIPAGTIRPTGALLFVVINAALFIVTTFFINKLCFYLSPVALAVVLGYSLTKRFTFLCHLVLGLGLSLAPVGAFIAVTSLFGLISILFGITVLFWVAGFDIIYALQDETFDKEQKLFSIPSYFGAQKALYISKVFHFIAFLSMFFAVFLTSIHYSSQSWLTWSGFIIFTGLLVYQHSLVKYNDLSKVNMAFFTTNGMASVVFGLFYIIDYFL
jgi:4-hydroxybenzoate polyprenyltransferase